MGVSGIAQFKSDINSAKSSVKTLEAQLALTEKEFKATGDAEAYMAKKSGELQAKLNAQKKVVASTEEALKAMEKNGVDRSTKAYQDMYRQLLKAKGGMADTQAEIAKLGTDTATAADNTDKMNDQLKQIGKGVSFENVTSGLKDVISKLENGAKAAINFGKKVAQSAMGSAGWADETLTTATKYGVDAETIQRMRNVAEFIDTDVDTILGAKSRLAKNKGNLAELIGVETNGMSVDEAFWKAGEAIMNLTDEFEQEEAAQKVFGKGWRELVPLFTAGQEKYNNLMAEQNVLSNEQVEKLGEADDAFKKIEQEVERMKNQFWAENADKITDLLQWVVDNKDAVVTALGAIAGAFGLLKLGEAAANVTKLLNGLKGLGFGGAADAAGGGGGGFIGKTIAKVTGGAGLKGLVAANGASLLAPFAAIAAAVTPAMLAQGADERRWAAQKETRLTAAASMSSGDKAFLIAAAEALDQHYRTTGDSAALLKGLESRGTIEKAKLLGMLAGESTSYGNNAEMELLRFWQSGGEGWDQARTDALLTTITDSYVKMAAVADTLNGTADSQTKGNSEMTAAAKDLQGLPGMVGEAVRTAMSNVRIYLDGTAITQRVNTGLAATVK
jgi:hypothetical protein